MRRLGEGTFSAPLVVFALEREAGPFRRLVKRHRLDVRVLVSGVGRAAARSATGRACRGLPRPPRLVVAAGFCGALAADLSVGHVVCTTNVVDWSGCLVGRRRASLPDPSERRLLSVDRVIGDPSEKQLLHRDYGADAVDMEAAGVAEVECGFGARFLAVRAVSDTADTRLSPLLVGLLAGGRVSPWRAAAAAARHPSLLGEFRRLARDTARAAENLAAALVAVIDNESPPAATGGLSGGE